MHLIGKRYAAEERARHAPTRCQRLRYRYSRIALGKIKALLDEHLETTLPGGKLGQALGYLGNQWPKLCRHIDNEAWPICNNACENSIRPFVLESKNWLFSDTVAGAEGEGELEFVLAIETCKANYVHVYISTSSTCSRRCRSRKRSTITKRCRLGSLASPLANRRPDRYPIGRRRGPRGGFTDRLQSIYSPTTGSDS
ncbi:MAG: transposase [Burkholderia sp.]